MKRFLLLAALVGCSHEPTLRDAVEDWAVATCDRMVRCGFTSLSWSQCELTVEEYLCDGQLDCTRPYRSPDRIVQCLAEYQDAPCSDPIPVCMGF